MPNFYWTDGENLPAQNFNFGDYSYIDGKQVLAVGRPDGVTYFRGSNTPDTSDPSLPNPLNVPLATANQTFYVNPAGDDNNDGSINFPFATPQPAYDKVSSIYWGEFRPFIDIADGNYVLPDRIKPKRTFADLVVVTGNLSNPENVIIDTSANTGASGRGIDVGSSFSRFLIRGMTIKANPSQVNLYCSGVGETEIDQIVFADGQQKILVTGNHRLVMNGRTLKCSVGGLRFLVVSDLSLIQAANATIEAVSGTVNFTSAFATVNAGGSLRWTNKNAGGAGVFTGTALIVNPGGIVSFWDSTGWGTGIVLADCSASGLEITSEPNRLANQLTIENQLRHGGLIGNMNSPAGATAHAMPIYNEAGTLLGYIPIYGAQW